MSKEPLKAREYNVNPLNAVSRVGGSRKDRYIREFRQQRDRYAERLSEAEEQYNYAPTNREKRVAEKAIEFLNQRIREMDANIAYIMRFT